MKGAYAILAIGIAAAVAAPPALAAEPCLHPRGIVSFKNLGRDALIVRATGGRRYRVDLGGRCLGIDDVITLGVRQRGGGMCVEAGDSIVYSFSGFGTQSCLITRVSLYQTARPGEAAAQADVERPPPD
jgi:hypothetical protein